MARNKPALTPADAMTLTSSPGQVRPDQSPGLFRSLRNWFDTSVEATVDPAREDRIDWLRAAPFVAMHLACLGVIWVGVSPTALIVAAALYAVRMFALTGFYHRYFSHRTFKTTRTVQFIFALIGASCVQRGPLWWASHHRNHHRHADTSLDPHSRACTALFGVT